MSHDSATMSDVSASMPEASAEALARAEFEAKMKTDMRVEMEMVAVRCATVEKEDWLNSQCKSMEVDVKVTGLHYRVKEFQKKNAKGRAEWRADMLRRIFVDTRVIEEDILYESRGGKKVLRDVIRNMHPLGQKDKTSQIGPAIIIAFTQSSVANDIKEVVRKDAGIELVKTKRGGRDPEKIKIFSHLPPILEALRNECLRERRIHKAKEVAEEGTKRFICNESLTWPWISLVVIDGESKTQIPFKLEDARLADPARTLALNHLRGVRKFTPFHVLTADEKRIIGPEVTTSIDNPTEGLRNAVASNDIQK